MAETPLVFEIATFAVLAVFFVVDLFIIGRKPHVPSTKECVQHIAFFVVMALIFGGLMWFFAGSKPAIEFYSGWLTEYSLSIDNLFVFVIIMSNFAVPKELQKFVLSVGITVALVLRGMFIWWALPSSRASLGCSSYSARSSSSRPSNSSPGRRGRGIP